MNNLNKFKSSIEVIPVIEVAIKSIHPEQYSDEGLFISKYQEITRSGKFLESPDGWFFPIDYLSKDIDSFAKFIVFESKEVGEFEICGGFQLYVNGKRIPSVSIGSSFRFAMKLADWMDDPKRNKNYIINIDNDKTVTFQYEGDVIAIILPNEKGKSAKVPYLEIKKKFELAQEKTRKFVQSIEPLIINQGNKKITTKMVKFVFGLK